MLIRVGLMIVVSLLTTVGTLVAHAQEATPVSMAATDEAPTTMVLVERGIHRTYVDSGEPGDSVGDMLIWGPNPLYDEANEVDTGATVHGVCVWFNVEGDCLLYETIVFPDGSTLETQGIQPGAEVPSMRTIIGGSGEYLGARGTIQMVPTEDETVWTRHFEIWP